MARLQGQWPFQPVQRPPLHFDNLRWTVAVDIETRDEALAEDLFGGIDRRDVVFGDCVAVRRVQLRRLRSTPDAVAVELAVGAVGSVPSTAAAAFVAEWLIRHARGRAERIVIGGRATPVRADQIRRALADALVVARAR